MPEFSYTDMLPAAADDTEYRLLSTEGISVREAFGREFLLVEPYVLTQLAATAMHDIAHLLRPAHLRQLRSILDDPEASGNDKFVAGDLLKNACIAAGEPWSGSPSRYLAEAYFAVLSAYSALVPPTTMARW